MHAVVRKEKCFYYRWLLRLEIVSNFCCDGWINGIKNDYLSIFPICLRGIGAEIQGEDDFSCSPKPGWFYFLRSVSKGYQLRKHLYLFFGQHTNTTSVDLCLSVNIYPRLKLITAWLFWYITSHNTSYYCSCHISHTLIHHQSLLPYIHIIIHSRSSSIPVVSSLHSFVSMS